MSDDITLRGGGVVAVATDGQLHLANGLAALGVSCVGWAERAERVARLDASVAPTGPMLVPVNDADAGARAAARAALTLRSAGEGAARLGGQVTFGAEVYGTLERTVASLFETVGAAAAWTIGRVPLLWMGGALGIGSVVLVRTVLRAAVGAVSTEAGEEMDAQTARRLRDLMATTGFVTAVRAVVSGFDDGLAGAAGIPLPITFALGDQGAGVTGVAAAALLVARGGDAAGVFTRGAVTTTQTSHRRADHEAAPRPPATFEDLVARMPGNREGDPQVRIERYVDGSGAEQWIVWSGGTIEAGIAPDSGEPWDNRSNITAVAGAAAESVEATLAAMHAARIPEGATVMHVGYSQGGIVAATVAASGRFDSSVVTFGAPVETVQLPADVPAVHVQHDEDVIPAFSGVRRDPLDGGTVVSRSLYDGGGPPPGDDPLPAHSRDRYRETARIIDDSHDTRLDGVRDRLTPLQGTGESWQYRADKVLP